MALDVNGAKFLLYARRHGVSFSKTATIGRQKMLLSPKDLREHLRRFGVEISANESEKLISGSDKFAERFLNILGAEEIVSFDASPYEHASVVHDFNQPIPDEFKNRFTALLDGGTLEHVFNFPTAIKNCMEMVKVGGHFLSIAPANNYFGHGFYQFSPELFFRIFSIQNGFEIQQVMIFEETPDSPWYEVADPDVVKERVWLINSQPSLLLVIAKRIKTVEIFGSLPQQSDYVAIWKSGNENDVSKPGSRFAGIPFRNLVRFPLTAVRQIYRRANRAVGMLRRRPKHFKKVDLP